MRISLQELMASSGVAFGTSGARGLVTAMTDRVCYGYTTAFLRYLESIAELGPAGEEVAVAGDLRPSTGRILAAVCRAVQDHGYRPVNCGRVPSPALALLGFEAGIPSIMVTGSHIPDDRNGIKFNKCSGEILKTDEKGMMSQVVEFGDQLFDTAGGFAEEVPATSDVSARALDAYVARYLDYFEPRALQGMRIGVYQHSAVGREVLRHILSQLGAETTALGRSETFIPVDTEAIRPEDVRLAREWAAKQPFHAIVSTDGDSDRPLISDERGQWLRGDVAGILCARFLGADTVCTPVSCNTAVEKSGWFQEVRRTRIGSPYVIAAMNQATAAGANRVVGYEANGGFLINSDIERAGGKLRALPTRDAVIVILSLLVLAKQMGKCISELAATLPQRFTASDRLKDFPAEKSRRILARFTSGREAADRAAIEEAFGGLSGRVQAIDRTDGLRVTFANDEVIHLRPSGNAPELRCYSEADTDERARSLNRQVFDVLAELTRILPAESL